MYALLLLNPPPLVDPFFLHFAVSESGNTRKLFFGLFFLSSGIADDD